jgi:hypothetical protein
MVNSESQRLAGLALGGTSRLLLGDMSEYVPVYVPPVHLRAVLL